MDDKEFRQKIEDEISKTRQAIEEYKEQNKPIAPENSIGRISRMDAINNKAVVGSALRQAEEKMKNLEFVSSKIGTADFGICIKCKKPIPLGRILVKPESVYCVNCAR